jgi:hypothetical protein
MNHNESHQNISSFLFALNNGQRDITWAVRAISLIGTLFNIFSSIVLINKQFKFRFYDFLLCRSICNLAVCLLGIFYEETVCKECTTDYWPLFINFFLVTLPLRAAFISTAISESLILINRLSLLFARKNSRFYNLSKTVSCILIEKFVEL